jgi:glutathione synthase/RimK-type ligase-like ATP-grasp enzyme
MKKILILTEVGDVHAYAVAEALRQKQADVVLWHTADFPTVAGETILFEGSERRLIVRGPAMDRDNFGFDTIWHRRPSYALDEHCLHPADRRFANFECSVFRRSFFSLLAPGAFWVNPPDAITRAGRKPVQHQIAHDVGFTTPATIYTNDPEAIRSFIVRRGGRIVYKTFHGVSWCDGQTRWTPYTSLITEDSLVEDDLLRAAPGIYQEIVEKAYELRITIMGEWVFSAKIDSQNTETGRLDWRKSYHELRMESCEIPLEVSQRCREMLRRLGIVFACFDVIVTPAGQYVFLELNETGQFLFLERFTGLPLLDAFSEFLLQARPDFAWNADLVQVRYPEVSESVQRLESESAQRHVLSPDRAIFETSGLSEGY